MTGFPIETTSQEEKANLAWLTAVSGALGREINPDEVEWCPIRPRTLSRFRYMKIPSEDGNLLRVVVKQEKDSDSTHGASHGYIKQPALRHDNSVRNARLWYDISSDMVPELLGAYPTRYILVMERARGISLMNGLYKNDTRVDTLGELLGVAARFIGSGTSELSMFAGSFPARYKGADSIDEIKKLKLFVEEQDILADKLRFLSERSGIEMDRATALSRASELETLRRKAWFLPHGFAIHGEIYGGHIFKDSEDVNPLTRYKLIDFDTPRRDDATIDIAGPLLHTRWARGNCNIKPYDFFVDEKFMDVAVSYFFGVLTHAYKADNEKVSSLLSTPLTDYLEGDVQIPQNLFSPGEKARVLALTDLHGLIKYLKLAAVSEKFIDKMTPEGFEDFIGIARNKSYHDKMPKAVSEVFNDAYNMLESIARETGYLC